MSDAVDLEVALHVVDFDDLTAGAGDAKLPEGNLRLHFFLSEHMERADQRHVTVVRMPSQLGSIVSLRPRLPPKFDTDASLALSASACVGVRMFAVSQLSDAPFARRFLVPVGGAVLMLTQLKPGSVHKVKLYDYCDRTASKKGTLKARVRLQCVRLGATIKQRLSRTVPERWQAVPEYFDELQEYAEQRMQAQLMAYTNQQLVPASASVQRTHVIRAVLETNGRHIPVMYWLSHAFWCSAVVQQQYWECAMRCALQLLDVTEHEYMSWPIDAPQKAALICTAAALYSNAGVVYVNDRTNRNVASQNRRRRRRSGAADDDDDDADGIVEVERFMDPLITRCGDCEDVSSLAYWLLKYLHQADADNADGPSPLLREAIRCVTKLYVPMVVIGEAIRPDAPERATIEEYPPSERLGHFYAMLVPVKFLRDAIRRAGHTAIDTASFVVTEGTRTEPVVCENTIFQIGLVRDCESYAPEQAAALEAAQVNSMRCMQRARQSVGWASNWTTMVDIASGSPFYGRIVKLMSDVLHPRVWSLAVTYDDRTYGVTMEHFVQQSERIVLRELTLQDDYQTRMARDAQAQCHPTAMPTPGDATEFEVTDQRLRTLLPTMSAEARQALLQLPQASLDPSDQRGFFVRQCTWQRILWTLDAPPTLRDVEAMRSMMSEGAYTGVRLKLLHVSNGIALNDYQGADDTEREVSSMPVGVLVVDMCTVAV